MTLSQPKSRREIINEVLQDLNTLTTDSRTYALEANITFFEVIRSYPVYMHWLATKARKLDGSLLLEVNDLLPRWDKEMHDGLVAMERRKFPGLIKPLVEALTERIMKHEKTSCLVANLGCGAMEVERQTIQALRAKQYAGHVIFVGIDQSPIAHAMAKKNLETLGADVMIKECETLDRAYVQQLSAASQSPYGIVLAKNDIFRLHEEFHSHLFDIIFSSLFKHHLPPARKNEFDILTATIAKSALEYDGYKSWGVMIPQTLTTWQTPILLNGTIFSDLRYHTKKELKKMAAGHKILFTKIGTYLLER